MKLGNPLSMFPHLCLQNSILSLLHDKTYLREASCLILVAVTSHKIE